MSSHILRNTCRCTEKSFRTVMDSLQMRLDEAIVSLEKVYLEFTPAMMANSVDPVLCCLLPIPELHNGLYIHG